MANNLPHNWKITQLAMDLDNLLVGVGYVASINHVDPSFLIVFEDIYRIPTLVMQIKNLLGIEAGEFKTVSEDSIRVFLKVDK